MSIQGEIDRLTAAKNSIASSLQTMGIESPEKNTLDQYAAQLAAIASSAPWLPLAGGTMTGPLTLSGNPTDDNQAANKFYVDSLAATSTIITLTSTGWTGDSAPFSQQVSCSIVAADTAVVAVDVDTPGTDADADAEAINAWALCTQRNPTQGAGTLTFYCTEKPTINIPVKVGVA